MQGSLCTHIKGRNSVCNTSIKFIKSHRRGMPEGRKDKGEKVYYTAERTLKKSLRKRGQDTESPGDKYL